MIRLASAFLITVLLTGTARADFHGQQSGGSAVIWPPQGTTAFGPPSKIWPATQPDGTRVVCSVTTSNCLQELLNTMLTKGSTDTYGGGGSDGSKAVTTFTGTLAVPTLRNQYFHMHGGGLFQTGNPAVDTPSVTIDSMVEGAFLCEGCQIASAPTTSAVGGGAASGSMPVVLLDPRNTLPFEGFIGIGASRIDLGNTSTQWISGQSDAVVKSSLTHAGITRNFIDAIEINGGGPSPTLTSSKYGYLVTDYPGGPSPNSYVQNLHRIGYIHLTSDVGLGDGKNATDGEAIFNNIYDVGGIEPRGAASVGVSAFGQGSVFRVGGIDNVAGTVQTCAATGTGATDNHFDVGCTPNTANIAVGVNFVAGSSNNTAWLRYVPINGGVATSLAEDGGTNNVIWRGATAFSKDGLQVVTIDAAGVQTGGAVLTGTTMNLPTGGTYQVNAVAGVTCGAGVIALTVTVVGGIVTHC